MSTLDIIEKENGLTASQLAERSQTGDLLLYANDMKEAPEWYRVCQGAAGKVALERRLPIIHVAIIIKDPPEDILEHYGLEPRPDGCYVFEATSSVPNPRLVYLKEWIAHEYDVEVSGGHLFWRKRIDSNRIVTPPEDFWIWLREAKALPYLTPNKWHMKEFWQGFFYMFVLQPSAFPAMIAIISRAVRTALLESLGPGLVRKAGAYLASGICALCLFVSFSLSVVVFGTPLLAALVNSRVLKFLKKNMASPYTKGYGKDSEGTLKFLICSVAAGESLRRLGLLDEERGSHPSLYLPKDFLPEGVGGEGNMLDKSLKQGFEYSRTLSPIANPFSPPPRRHSPSILTATNEASHFLWATLATATESIAYDLAGFERDLAEDVCSGLRKNSILYAVFGLEEDPSIQNDTTVGIAPLVTSHECDPIREEEPLKED